LDSKVELILEVALSSFSEKGYYSTSMQEIADQCGMSKGSLYKFFKSKEELFIKVCEYQQDQLFKKATTINIKQQTSKKEWLMEQIIILMEDYLQKKDFFMMQMKEMPFDQNEKLKALRKKMKSRFLNWQKECLFAVYGMKIEPFVWDLIIILHGMIKEYLFYILHTNELQLVRQSSKFIVERFDSILEDLLQQESKPVFTSSIMKRTSFYRDDTESKEGLLEGLLQEIKQKINYMKDENKKEYLLSTLDLLKDEMNTPKPRTYLMDALLTYLEQEELLIVLVKRLRSILN